MVIKKRIPRASFGLARDVRQAGRVGKKILKRKTKTKKKLKLSKFKVPNIKLVKSYGKEAKGII